MTHPRRAFCFAVLATLFFVHLPVTAEAAAPFRVSILSPEPHATVGWIMMVDVLIEGAVPESYDVEVWVDEELLFATILFFHAVNGPRVDLPVNTTSLGPGPHELQVVVRETGLGAAARSQRVPFTPVDAPLPVVEGFRAKYVGDAVRVEGYVTSPVRRNVSAVVTTPYGEKTVADVRRFAFELPLVGAPDGEVVGAVILSDGSGNEGVRPFRFVVGPPVVVFDRVVDGVASGEFAVPESGKGTISICDARTSCTSPEDFRIGGVAEVQVDLWNCESSPLYHRPCGFEARAGAYGTYSVASALPVRILVTAYT